jgi:hypothetical protein
LAGGHAELKRILLQPNPSEAALLARQPQSYLQAGSLAGQ